MSAWKNLNQQDVYTTTYIARKSWSISSQSFEEYGIQILYGETGSNREFYLGEGILYSGSNIGNGEYQELVYNSLQQLYYRSFDSSSGLLESTSSYDHYLDTTLSSSTRLLNNHVVIVSIPRNITGTHLQPGTVEIISGSSKFIDNSEGQLTLSGSTQNVGNVFYSHGLVVITDENQSTLIKNNPSLVANWKANLPIYTYNYNIKLADYEFNTTLNPTALSGSTGDILPNITGSAFQPYITSVGLYNGSNELIAVGKLTQPLPKSSNTETTIQIKLDL